jgi:ribosomal small subunit protein bTHX
MGKGDQKTRRGKIINKSYGVTRPRDVNRAKVDAIAHNVVVDDNKTASEAKAVVKAAAKAAELKEEQKQAEALKAETVKAEKKADEKPAKKKEA